MPLQELTPSVLLPQKVPTLTLMMQIMLFRHRALRTVQAKNVVLTVVGEHVVRVEVVNIVIQMVYVKHHVFLIVLVKTVVLMVVEGLVVHVVQGSIVIPMAFANCCVFQLHVQPWARTVELGLIIVEVG